MNSDMMSLFTISRSTDTPQDIKRMVCDFEKKNANRSKYCPNNMQSELTKVKVN